MTGPESLDDFRYIFWAAFKMISSVSAIEFAMEPPGVSNVWASAGKLNRSHIQRSDWIIDIGPGAGDEGGRVVAEGPPSKVAKSKASRTAPFLFS